MRRKITFLILGLTAWAFPAASEDTITLNVTVTAVSGRSVFLDIGRSSGVAPGQLVVFYPPGEARLEGYVKGVTSDNTRVELAPNDPLPPVGTKGEVEVPLPDPEPDDNTVESDKNVPEHPPWSRELEEFSDDTPLLASTYGQRPQDRPVDYRGRIYGQLQFTHDTGGGRDNDFYYNRIGTWMEVTNPFKKGGRILFSGQANQRGADLFDTGNDSETDLRLERFSYATGGHEYSPYRLEVGRFYSTVLPEFGLMDGVEGMAQLGNGWRIGVGAGLLPLPFPDREEGDDYGVNLFLDYQSDAPNALSATLAYQKSWHKGDADRDLVMARVNVKPTDSLWLYGSVKADVYTSDDSIKGSGIEVTEFWAQARFVPDRKKGASISVSHYAWPELKRDDYKDLPVDLVDDGSVDRVSVSGWYRIMEKLRLTGRFNFWEDQDNSGDGGEFSADWYDLWHENSSLYTSVYYTSGSFNDGMGYRIRARQRFKDASGFLGYDLYRYTVDGLVSGDEDFTRQTVRAGVDWSRGSFYYSLTGDYYFGDDENAIGIGVYTEFRF